MSFDSAKLLEKFHGAFQLMFCMLFSQAINDTDVHNIVLSYLVHNSFKDTVESFTSSTGMKQPVDHLEDMEKRKGRSFALYLRIYRVKFVTQDLRV